MQIWLSRAELYDLVWHEPVWNLAYTFNISDRGLSKLCKKVGVPTPPRGYWRRVATGTPVEIPPLCPVPEELGMGEWVVVSVGRPDPPRTIDDGEGWSIHEGEFDSYWTRDNRSVQALTQLLEAQAEAWHRAESIRDYLRAVRNHRQNRRKDSAFLAWYGWAMEVTNSLDPVYRQAWRESPRIVKLRKDLKMEHFEGESPDFWTEGRAPTRDEYEDDPEDAED